MGVYRSLNYQQLHLLLLFVYMCKNVHGLLVVQRCEWSIPAPSFPSPNLLIFIQQRVPLIMANVLFMHPYTRAIAGHKDGKPIFDVNSNIFRFCIRMRGVSYIYHFTTGLFSQDARYWEWIVILSYHVGECCNAEFRHARWTCYHL